MSSESICDRTVLVCQGRSCRKDNSAAILTKFQRLCPPDIQIIPCGCLGKCGNGPTVLILPETRWYHRVCSQDVALIVETLKSLKFSLNPEIISRQG